MVNNVDGVVSINVLEGISFVILVAAKPIVIGVIIQIVAERVTVESCTLV